MKKRFLLTIALAIIAVCVLCGCRNEPAQTQTTQVNMFRSSDTSDTVYKVIPNIDLKVLSFDEDTSEETLPDEEDDVQIEQDSSEENLQPVPDNDNKQTDNSGKDNNTAAGNDEEKQSDKTEMLAENAKENKDPENAGENNNIASDEGKNTVPDNGEQFPLNQEEISPITKARAKFITNSNPYVSEETAIYYVQLFEEYQKIVPYMEVEALMGIARIESVFYADVTSKYAGPDGKHFRGLMQLHEDYESIYGYAPGQLYDPACNIECACRLLKYTADAVPSYNYDQTYLICAYHQGPVNISNFDYSYPNLVYQFADQIKSLYPAN